MSMPNRKRGGLMIILPSITFARTQISGVTNATPGTFAISGPQAAGSREKIGMGAPGCIATRPVMRLNVTLTRSSSPLATENRPIIPMIATVSPTSERALRIGRVMRLRSANFNMECGLSGAEESSDAAPHEIKGDAFRIGAAAQERKDGGVWRLLNRPRDAPYNDAPRSGRRHSSMPEIDYYKTLGVNRGASAEEIRKAYKKLARK